MPPKGLIILQNGRESVVPDTPAIRKFWEDYNAQIQRSKIANKRFVTVLEADAETVEKHLAPAPVKRNVVKAQENSTEAAALRSEVSELKSIILRMQMAAQVPVTTVPTLPTLDTGVLTTVAPNNGDFQTFD